MDEALRSALDDIRRKLNAGAYQNEEHVRLSLVARIVQALGWDIWNPREVCTEYAVAPDEDRTKVDMALFARDGYPAVLIEIKAVGKMEGNLEVIETQVRNYNRDITAPFSIITDGRIWRFYYVKGEGTFSQKLFDKLDLTESNTFKTAKKLESYLLKDEIKNGNAEEEAKKKLNVTQKQEAMANAYPEADRLTKGEPFPNLPDALITVMNRMGFNISREEAVAYIRSRDNVPPPSTPGEEKEPTFTPYPITKKITNDLLIREIVITLQQLGGSAHKKDVENRIFKKYAPELQKNYYQQRVKNGSVKWRNMIEWAREHAKRKGYIKQPKPGDGRGVWILTNEGIEYK